jgi:predicted dehydrogenase
MDSSMIRVGIIGTGVGLRTHLPNFRELDDVDVVAVAGSSADRTRSVANSHGIKYALDARALCELPEIDLVCVTSPNPYHRVHAEEALIAGKHVLCEKPLAMDMRETCELIALAASRPTQLSLINHQLRFNPYLKKVKDMIADGAIGRPYYIRVHQQSTAFADRQAPWNWNFDSQQGGGVRLAMGSHQIDLVHYWLGETAIAVQGAMDPVVHQRRLVDDTVTDVKASGFFSASLEFESGINVHLFATAASCGQSRFDFSLYGEEGELHFDLSHKLRGAFLSNRGVVEPIAVTGVTDRERRNEVSIFSGSFAYFAPAIVSAIRSNDWSCLEPAARFADSYKIQIVLDALAWAANDGTMHRLSGRERHDVYV